LPNLIFSKISCFSYHILLKSYRYRTPSCARLSTYEAQERSRYFVNISR